MIKSAIKIWLIFFLLILVYLIGLEKFTPSVSAHANPCGSISVTLELSPPWVSGFDNSFSSPTQPYPPNSSQWFQLFGNAGHMDVYYFGPYGVNDNPSITCSTPFSTIGAFFSSGPWSWTVPFVSAGQTNKYFYAVNAHRRSLHGGLDWSPAGEGCAWDGFVWYNSAFGFRDTHFGCTNVGLRAFYVGSPAPQSDLYISSWSPGPGSTRPAGSIGFQAGLTNGGSAAANNGFWLRLVVDGAVVPSDFFISCCMGSGITNTYFWSYTINTPGSHWYQVCADIFNNVTNESNESNNCTPVVSFTVIAPDYIISSSTVSPNPGIMGSLMSFSGTVFNQGNTAASSTSTTRLLIDGTIISSDQPTGALAASASEIENWSWNPTSVGSHSYQICADILNNVFEANAGGTGESNNCILATAFTVNQAFNYTLTNSGSIIATQGQSGSNTISVNLNCSPCTTQTVTLTPSGLPTGASATWPSSNACAPNCSRTLIISTSSSTPPGTYTITVTGSPLSRTTSFSLIVNPSPTPWIQTTGGDVHTQEGISIPGGP